MHTYSLLSPLKPSWKRYVRIFWKSGDISIYRALEYEALSRVDYRGRLLDFGGGRRAHYYPSLQAWLSGGEYHSANIDPGMEPTYLVEADGNLPIATGSFDMVLSVNTLEHVYALDVVLDELLRVLKPGGRLVLAVPFLYRVHGCPDDYNRPTASWWRETLSRKGVRDIEITPLVWDGPTTGVSVIDGVPPLSRLRRVVVPLYGLLYGLLKRGGDKDRYPAAVGEALANLALGYVICVEKAA